MHKPSSIVEEESADSLENSSSEEKKSEQGESSRREVVTMEVPGAMWVSLVLDFRQKFTGICP
jgi:hypothetical protein